ncbi:MAG: hypothetical protein IKH04_08715 [Kiritimatiellae bacterium]|nr:hypothetical protein [Kiritimatiellia bacterium]
MLEFEENRPKARRRPRAILLALPLLALCAAICARHRHGGAAEPGAPASSQLLSRADAERVADILNSRGAAFIVGDMAAASAVADASGGTIAARNPPASIFGTEFSLLPRTGWLVPEADSTNAIATLLFAGVPFTTADAASAGTVILPAVIIADNRTPPPSGVFLDWNHRTGPFARFFPTDEWIEAQTSIMERPTVPRIAWLSERARASTTFLKYLASIADGPASAAVAARIRDLSPSFPRRPVDFGGRIVWRGARISGAGDAKFLRHWMSIPSGATPFFRDCSMEFAFVSLDGKTLATDIFHPDPDSISASSYSTSRDSVDFTIDRPIPPEVGNSPWNLEIAVSESTQRGPVLLEPDGQHPGTGSPRHAIIYGLDAISETFE